MEEEEEEEEEASEASLAREEAVCGEIERALVAWAVSKGADVSRIEWPVDDGYGGRKVMTRGVVEAGTPFVRVPEALMMTESMAMRGAFGEELLRRNVRGDAALALFVLFEAKKGEASEFYPYLRSLPGEPGTICDWSSEELEELWDHELVDKAEARNKFLEETYERIFFSERNNSNDVLSDRDWFDRKRFRYAWQIVQSRAFGRRLKESALVPLADLLNHSEGADTSYDLKDGVFSMCPTSQTVQGEALNRYGVCASNAKLLLDYGFATENNSRDEIRLPVSCFDFFPLDDTHFSQRKRHLLSKFGKPHFTAFRLTAIADPTKDSAFDILKVSLAAAETLEYLQRHGLSNEYDPSALRALISLLDDLLSNLGQHAPDDTPQLKSLEATLQNLSAMNLPRLDDAKWFWQDSSENLLVVENNKGEEEVSSKKKKNDDDDNRSSSSQKKKSANDVYAALRLRRDTCRRLFALRYRRTRLHIAQAARAHVAALLPPDDNTSLSNSHSSRETEEEDEGGE